MSEKRAKARAGSVASLSVASRIFLVLFEMCNVMSIVFHKLHKIMSRAKPAPPNGPHARTNVRKHFMMTKNYNIFCDDEQCDSDLSKISK